MATKTATKVTSYSTAGSAYLDPVWEINGLDQAAVETEVGGASTFVYFASALNNANTAKTYIKMFDAVKATAFTAEESTAPEFSIPVGAGVDTDFTFDLGIEQFDNLANSCHVLATKTVGSANTSNEAQVSPDANFDLDIGFSRS